MRRHTRPTGAVRIWQRIRVLNTFLRLSYAGFFAITHHAVVPFYSSAYLSPLKNDGGGVLLCHDILMLNECIKKRIGDASCPRLSGSKRTTFRGAKRRCKSVCDALPWLRWRRSRRKGQVWAEPENNSNLCTHPCPYRLV